MTTLRVRGGQRKPAEEAEPRRAGLRGAVRVRRKASIEIETTRAAIGVPEDVANLAPEDVARLRLDDGLDLFVRTDELDELVPEAVRRVGDVVEIDPTLAGDPATRGPLKVVLRALEIFGVDVVGEGVKSVARAFEDKTLAPGLRKCRLKGPFQLDPLPDQPIPVDRPLLVFVHGTFSTTQKGFGALWEPEPEVPNRLPALDGLYPDRAYAFEHRTLTESPIQNAIELVDLLPRGARLHLVTHSRGGLIGELLCRGQRADGRAPYLPEEIDACFTAPRGASAETERAFAEERERLVALGARLQDKQLTIERFVRVACPARGTSLASQRLDRWLSVFASLVTKLPHLGAPFVDALFDLVLALVSRKAKPEHLPGLAAMMPDAPLIRLLNHTRVGVQSDLTVLSGDSEGASLWGRTKLLVPDLFFGGDHDLVVNTTSMYGGCPRAAGAARFLLDTGGKIDHFRYFTNRRTVDALVEGLSRLEGAPGSFVPLERAKREVIPSRSARGPGGPRPVAIVVPGIGGSHITVDGERVWVDPFELSFGKGIASLAIGAARVAPESLVASVYGRLVEFLADTHDVVAFPYDWRKSLRVEAARFATALSEQIDAAARVQQPVRIVAHSTGGLLTRLAFALEDDLVLRMRAQAGSRVLMLGTPNGGSWSIPRLLLAQERLVRVLALADFRKSHREILDVFSAFPGVLEMLPAAMPGGRDLFADETWAELARIAGGEADRSWVAPASNRLSEARALRALLDRTPVDPDLTLYVAGIADRTPVDFDIDPQHGRIRFLATRRGDGRVPWATGIPKDVPSWYMAATHGDLASDEAGFPALLDLLQNGRTSRLPKDPPGDVRGISDRPAELTPIEPDDAPMLPEEQGIAAAALGGSSKGVGPGGRRRDTGRRMGRRVAVSITHGDLAYARHTVTVGHYANDTIVGAEAELDRRLGGRMSRRRALGLYPGELGTSEVFSATDARGEGALVVGLGQVGELTPARLQRGFARAALDFALARLEDDRHRPPRGTYRSAKLSPLLIGTGAAGMTVRQALFAMLRGVRDANAHLRAADLDGSVAIDEVEFIELWEDVAFEAASVLSSCAAEDPVLAGELDCPSPVTVRSGSAALVRTRFQEAAGWWDRLRIVTDPTGALRFYAITGRARNEVTLVPTQRALLDAYLGQATGGIADSRELARSLFERLLPLRLKDGSLDQRDLVLVLDEQSAGYPWELLEDGWTRNGEPLAVRAGVVRQLETERFRAAVVTTAEDAAFVVGDPLSDFATLPAAGEEAKRVGELLRSAGFGVESRIRADALAIGTGLDARAYRVLHLAGHGVHDHPLAGHETLICEACGRPRAPRSEKISGMVLSNGAFLTPGDVEQMRQVPELVFLNCCYLGRLDAGGAEARRNDRHQLAANLAGQFIRMGARAVVAAGWEVQDDAALLFATSFYERMLAGESFGRAVRIARRSVYESNKSINTWGAYQCYGDPDYVLMRGGRTQSAGRTPEPFASPREVVVALQNLEARAEVAGARDLDQIRESVERTLAGARMGNEGWLRRADVLAAWGAAEAALGNLGAAVQAITDARKAQSGTLSLKHLELLANCTSRHAVEVAKRDRKAALEQCARAIESLEGLIALGDTVERRNLLGSSYKRLAWISRDDREVALRNMVTAYGEAAQLAKQHERYDPYPIQNWLSGRVVLVWLGGEDPELERDVAEWLPKAEQEAERRERSDPDFWSAVALADLGFTRNLIDLLAAKPRPGAQDEDWRRRWDAVAELYERGFERGVSPLRRRSVLDQFEFMEAMARAARRVSVARELERTHQRLTA